MLNIIDRRSTSRVEYTCPIKMIRASSETEIAIIHNISEGGISITANTDMKINEKYELMFELPLNGTVHDIIATCVIINKQGSNRFGIMFITIADDGLKHLKQFVAQFNKRIAIAA